MEMKMAENTREVRTTDLALAASLRVNGYLPSRLELKESRNVVWVYESLDGLDEMVEDYQKGLVEVEPRDYNRALGRTRGEMFDFLRANDVSPPRARQ